MSLYRRLIVAVAALGLATSVFAADENATTTSTTPTDTTTTTTTSAANDSSATTTATTVASTDKVDVNKASVKELMKIKGLTAAKAKAIVVYRKKHGDFKSVDELREVKAFKKINDKKMQLIEDQLTTG